MQNLAIVTAMHYEYQLEDDRYYSLHALAKSDIADHALSVTTWGIEYFPDT